MTDEIPKTAAVHLVAVDAPRAVAALSGALDGSDGPSPVPNMDWPTFKNLLARALAGDPDVPPQFLTFLTEARRVDLKKGEARERWQDLVLRQVLSENLRRLQELLDTKQVERGLLRADIIDDERRLSLLADHKLGRRQAEMFYRTHGEFRLSSDGSLADAGAEDMLRAWELRTGKTADRTDADDTQAALSDQQDHEDAEAVQLELTLRGKEERLEELDADIKDLEAARAEAEAALESGVDLQSADRHLQQELVAKAPGTHGQRQQLADRLGMPLLSESQGAANEAEFGESERASVFNRHARRAPDPDRTQQPDRLAAAPLTPRP